MTLPDRARRPGWRRSLLLIPLHCSPLIAGALLLLPSVESPHIRRLLLLLLALSLVLRLGWRLSYFLSPHRIRACWIALAVCCLATILGPALDPPIWVMTGAMFGGLLILSAYIHAAASNRLAGQSNLRLLCAALGFILLLDSGLTSSPWRWDLHLFGPGPGYTSDASVRQLQGIPFLPPRDERGRDVPLKPTQRFRALLIGGSSAAGRVAPQDGTMQAVLQRGLRDQGLDAEVINGAWDGYVSYYMVLDAVEGYTRLEPDLVLMYLGANDISLIDTMGDQFDRRRRPALVERLRRRPFYQLINSLLYSPRRLLRPTAPIPAVSKQVFEDNLRALRELYGEVGARCLLLIEADQAERTQDYYRALLSAAEQAGLETVNTDLILRQTYTAPSDYMEDQVHPNALGHWSIGMIMLGEIQARGLLPGV